MEELISSGKVRHIGASNFASWQISESGWTSLTNELNQFVSLQTRYSVLTRDIEKEILPVCAKHDVSLLPYFPLESGLLTRKVTRDKEAPKGSRLA